MWKLETHKKVGKEEKSHLSYYTKMLQSKLGFLDFSNCFPIPKNFWIDKFVIIWYNHVLL